MTIQIGEPATEPLGAPCPYLGMDYDPTTRCMYATRQHRCYRPSIAVRIEPEHQLAFCLTEAHTDCPVFAGQELPRPSRAAVRVPSLTSIPALPSLRVPPLPSLSGLPRLPRPLKMPARPRMLARPRVPALPTLFRPQVVAGALGVVLLGVALVGVRQALVAGDGATAVAEVPAATVAPVPVVEEVTRAPVAVATLAPPTAAPTPAPAPTPIRYVVRAGDTLNEIAMFFGAPPRDIIRLNNLPPDGRILAGQELLIPAGP